MNMQWTYVIVHIDGTVVGTESPKVAQEFALSDEHTVINIKTATTLDAAGSHFDIPEQQDYKL